jgi:hypothetical protein
MGRRLEQTGLRQRHCDGLDYGDPLHRFALTGQGNRLSQRADNVSDGTFGQRKG